jgi:hypothetical protein
MDSACSTNGEEKEGIKDIDGKSKGKRPLGRPMYRLADNIKMDLRE